VIFASFSSQCLQAELIWFDANPLDALLGAQVSATSGHDVERVMTLQVLRGYIEILSVNMFVPGLSFFVHILHSISHSTDL
jgi:hypothetical protein